MNYSKPYQWIQFLVRFRILLLVNKGAKGILANISVWENLKRKVICMNWIYEGIQRDISTCCVQFPEKSLSFLFCYLFCLGFITSHLDYRNSVYPYLSAFNISKRSNSEWTILATTCSIVCDAFISSSRPLWVVPPRKSHMLTIHACEEHFPSKTYKQIWFLHCFSHASAHYKELPCTMFSWFSFNLLCHYNALFHRVYAIGE